MTEKINNGGSAFPESYVGKDRPHEGIGDGMTLRDYFAAKAMALAQADGGQGTAADAEKELGMEPGTYSSKKHWPLLMAKYAYEYADAMLKARETP